VQTADTDLVAERIRHEYEARLPKYYRLIEEVFYLLESELGKTTIRVHSITHRAKTLESVARKIASRVEGETESEPAEQLDSVHDIAGLRVVCLFRDDIDALVATITHALGNCVVDDKLVDFDTSATGYQSVHIVGTLPPSFAGSRYDGIKDLFFEIQVRTIAMDAWANISRHLNYRVEGDVPREQKRSFRALAGLFYVADTEFQALSNMRDEHLEDIHRESIEKPESLLMLETTADNLAEYLSKSPLYRDRRPDTRESLSILAQDLRDWGYDRLDAVDEMVRRQAKVFLAKEKSAPPNNGRFNAVGRVRMSIRCENPAYDQYVQDGRPRRAQRDRATSDDTHGDVS
jgi:putative GTP pyrophosphokinase